MAKFAQTPRLRPVMSEEQRRKLSDAQKAYIASDPRWAEHRAKLVAAQKRPSQRAKLSERQLAYMQSDPRWPEHEARWRAAAVVTSRLTLLPEEVQVIVAERRKGRTMEYIAEQLCLDRGVLRRELKALGITTERRKIGPVVKRGNGFWRSFD